MAYPTGSGSEVLRRGAINAQGNSATAFTFDGSHITTGQVGATVPANHIITILSIVICEQSNATRNFTIYINNSHGSLPQINIFEQQDVGAYQTFVIADKIVLIGGDNLKINAGGSANFDVTYTYVDQDWS